MIQTPINLIGVNTFSFTADQQNGYTMLLIDMTLNAVACVLKFKRTKGIAKPLVKTFRHQLCQDAFHNKTESYVEMTSLRSKTHTLSTHKTRKRGLSAWEDKRCWLSENESLPYGSSLSSVTWECSAKRRKKDVPASGDVELPRDATVSLCNWLFTQFSFA